MVTRRPDNNVRKALFVSSRNDENITFDNAPVASTQRVLSPESCKQLLLKLREKDIKKLKKNSDKKTEAVSSTAEQPLKVLSPEGCKKLLSILKEKELMKREIENRKQQRVLPSRKRKLTTTNRFAETGISSRGTISSISKKAAPARKMSRCKKTLLQSPQRYCLAKGKSNINKSKIVNSSVSEKHRNRRLSSTTEFVNLENKFLNDSAIVSNVSITTTPSKSNDLLNNMNLNNEGIIKEIKSTFEQQCELMHALQRSQARILSLITKLEKANRNLNSVAFSDDIPTETSNKIEDLRKVVLTKNIFAQSVLNDSPSMNDLKLQNTLDMYNKQKSFCKLLLTPRCLTNNEPQTWREEFSLKIKQQCLLLQDTPIHK